MGNTDVAELVVSRPSEQVLAAVKAVLTDAEALTIVSLDEAAGEIAADVDRSWKSFGERIYVSVESGTAGQTRLMLQSKSSFRPTLVDWGKNRENLEWLVQAVKERLNI